MSDHIETAEHDQTQAPAATNPTGRRALLGKGLAAAAAAAAAGAVLGGKQAEALDGDPLIIGSELQTAETPTALRAPAFGDKVILVVHDTSFTPADSQFDAAIAGWGASRHGIYGSSSMANGVGVIGTTVGNAGAGVNGLGYGTNSFGVSGIGPAAGVRGESARVGVEGVGGIADFFANGNGFIWLGKAGVATTPGGGAQGAIARDNEGTLWYAYDTNKWRKLAGAATGGQYHPITPVRVYDSRAAAPTPGALARNASRVVSVADGRNPAGAVVTANAVPAGATAVTFNLTVTGQTGPNYLALTPGDAGSFSTSVINWGAAVDTANGGTIKLDGSRQVKVWCGDQAGSTHFILDVTGFYM